MRPGCVLIGVLLVLTVVPAATAERLVGNARDNRIVGTQARDTIFGRRGDDVLAGRAGRDRIDGEEDNDVVLGGGGRDTLFGRGLDDTLGGGPRPDTIYAGFGSDVVSGGGGNDVIYAADRDARLDSVDCGPGRDRAFIRRGDYAFNCESVVRRRRGPRLDGTYNSFTAGQDVEKTTSGNGSSRELWAGLGGNDKLSSLAGADVLWGNNGHDVLEGGNGADWLLGGNGNDRLYGGPGSDRLWGGTGADFLDGDAEVDGEPRVRDNMPDLLFAVEDDGRVDIVVCGHGDRAVVRRGDRVRNGSRCARIIRIPRG